jgi:putative transcriptional regulator
MLTFFAIAVAALLAVSGTPVAAEEPLLANGVFLVAKPELVDPHFRETVVLVTEPRIGGGPLGVIVNRPVAARVSEVVPDIGAVPERFDQIYGGGPVARGGLIFLMHSAEPVAGALPVLADVWLSADVTVLRSIIAGETKVDALRVYAGYAGWAPGQLQNEIRRGGWYVTRADVETVFAVDAASIWPQLIRRLSARHTRVDPARLCGARGVC